MGMSFSECRGFGLLLLLFAAIDMPAAAQEKDVDVRRELAEMRTELAELRAEIAALKAARQSDQPPVKDPALELLEPQVAELAQTKVESTSRFPVKLFGTIHAHVFGNSGDAELARHPEPGGPPPATANRHVQRARCVRRGSAFTADGPTLGSVRTSAVVAMDFFGGIPGFQTGQVMGLPRLLVAFARLDGEKTGGQIGQDHMMLAPRIRRRWRRLPSRCCFDRATCICGRRRSGSSARSHLGSVPRAASSRRLAAISSRGLPRSCRRRLAASDRASGAAGALGYASGESTPRVC